MVLVDTGFLVALLHQRDSLHERAKAWASQGETKARMVTEQVFFEVMNQFSRQGLRHLALLAQAWVFENASVQFVASAPDLLDEAWDLFSRHEDKEWSLTDCVSFALMRRRGITTALAYDLHFEQACFVALLRRDP